jgi:hypothetical protein
LEKWNLLGVHSKVRPLLGVQSKVRLLVEAG